MDVELNIWVRQSNKLASWDIIFDIVFGIAKANVMLNKYTRIFISLKQRLSIQKNDRKSEYELLE